MRDNERKELTQLPDSPDVWCGCVDVEALDGLSWTTDREVAQWFAHRYAFLKGGPSVVVQGKVEKRHVLAWLSRRNESEVLAFPKHVKGRHVVPHVREGHHTKRPS